MPRMLLIILALLIFCCPLSVSAQEEQLTDDQLESRLGSLKNPFKSQLPDIIEEVKTKPVMEVDVTPVVTTEQADDWTPIIDTPKQEEPALSTVMPEQEEFIPLPPLKVSGVIWNSDRPQAILNDHIVDIGDTFLNIKILDIQQTSIEGEFHGRTVTIRTQRSQL